SAEPALKFGVGKGQLFLLPVVQDFQSLQFGDGRNVVGRCDGHGGGAFLQCCSLEGKNFGGVGRGYSWRSGSLLVSRESATAIREMDAAPARYQAGARSLAVVAIRRVATNGAVPPKSALERLKLTAKPL